MEYKFTSSVLKGGNAITPQILTINDHLVTWKLNKGASRLFLASNKITIVRNSIISVEIINKIIGADIVISTTGSASIYAQCFDKNDALFIKGLLLSN